MLHRTILIAATASVVLTASLQAEERTWFDFDSPRAADAWRPVNDGVMGGRSQGRFRISDEKTLVFFGVLSLENNGGFASVRGRLTKPGLANDDVIVAKVRGDGREYKFNVYTQRNLSGITYRQSFATKKGEWTEVRFPASKFYATWRGRRLSERLDPGKVAGVSFLLGDKKPGPFKLEVAWVKVVPKS